MLTFISNLFNGLKHWLSSWFEKVEVIKELDARETIFSPRPSRFDVPPYKRRRVWNEPAPDAELLPLLPPTQCPSSSSSSDFAFSTDGYYWKKKKITS